MRVVLGRLAGIWLAFASGAYAEPFFAGFTDPVVIPTGRGPRGVSAADLNGDGNADMIVGLTTDKEFMLVYGRGDGTFDDPIFVNATGGVFEVAIGDVDGDGDLDLVVPTSGPPGPVGVSIYLNKGFGDFTYSATYPAGPSPTDAALADFNGDGFLDIVATSQVGSSAYVILGNGDGTFQSTDSYGVGNVPVDVAVGDLNSDGHVDFVTANGFSDDLTIRWNNGDDFAESVSIRIGHALFALDCIDVDRDNDVDIVVAVGASQFGGIIIISNEHPKFEIEPVLQVGSGNSSNIVLHGDFNNDGMLDLLSNDFGEAAFKIFFGSKSGEYLHGDLFNAPLTPYDAAVADLDSDGDLDLMVVSGNNDTVSIYFNQTMAPSHSQSDLNGDGVVNGHDLAMLLASWGGDGPGDLNSSGMTNGADLAQLLEAWGRPR